MLKVKLSVWPKKPKCTSHVWITHEGHVTGIVPDSTSVLIYFFGGWGGRSGKTKLAPFTLSYTTVKIKRNQLNEKEGQDLSSYHSKWGHSELIQKWWKLLKPISHFLIICVESQDWLASSGVLLFPETIDLAALMQSVSPFTTYRRRGFSLIPSE